MRINVPTFRRGGAVPLADIDTLRTRSQRTAAVRIVLALALAGTLVLLFHISH